MNWTFKSNHITFSIGLFRMIGLGLVAFGEPAESQFSITGMLIFLDMWVVIYW